MRAWLNKSSGMLQLCAWREKSSRTQRTYVGHNKGFYGNASKKILTGEGKLKFHLVSELEHRWTLGILKSSSSTTSRDPFGMSLKSFIEQNLWFIRTCYICVKNSRPFPVPINLSFCSIYTPLVLYSCFALWRYLNPLLLPLALCGVYVNIT